MDKHWKCTCGKSFWTFRGLEDHCRMKGKGHCHKRSDDKPMKTLDYLLEKSSNDAMSDDEFSFSDSYLN